MASSFFLYLFSLFAVVSCVDYIWTPDYYEKVRNYLKAGLFDDAYELINLMPLKSDDIYWKIIPNVVYVQYKNDVFRLYEYANRLYQAGYRNNRLFHMYTRRLIELDDLHRARELIITVERLDRNDSCYKSNALHMGKSQRHRSMEPLEFAKTVFAKAASDHNMHLLGVCKSLLEHYSSKEPGSAECTWFYAKTLMKLNDVKSALSQFQNLTHYNSLCNDQAGIVKNVYWKSCIEYGNVLMDINGFDAVWESRQNPFVWALNRLKYYKAEACMVCALNGVEYYKRRFQWIRRRMHMTTFIRLLNELCRRFPHDQDAVEIRTRYLKKFGFGDTNATGARNDHI